LGGQNKNVFGGQRNFALGGQIHAAFPKGFNLTSYAWGVTCELREALKGLIEENMSE